MKPITGHHGAVLRILQAIGDNVGLAKRVVIDIQPCEAVTVYIQRYMSEEEADAIADMLEGNRVEVREVKSVDVNERGEVSVTGGETQ